MTLFLGDKLIAGSFKAGASWEVGDVGISAFGIDEALNKRRYLNGQVISQAQFVEFTAMLKSRVSVYPNLATTEVNWQAEVTNSKLGQCGKFVIDDVAGTIRLPKVVNLQGLMDLTHLGEAVEAGLPNITGKIIGREIISNDKLLDLGALYTESNDKQYYGTMNNTGSNFGGTLLFDASRSNPIYGNSTTVQPESVQYPYFIQVATGVETSVDVSREIELNNPFSLLDYKYSEYELSNASWLLSNGQWNSGAVYQSVYNLLLQIYNGTTTKAGVSVKLSTETYTDTDFVLNTGDTTFRLPIKVKLASGNAVVGNGIGIGITNGSSNCNITSLVDWNGSDAGGNALKPANKSFGANVGSDASYDAHSRWGNGKIIGITTDPEKSGIETSANGLYLYFYVGEVVQDANIIAAGQALTDIADLKAHSIVETYQNGDNWYRIYSDGWCEQGGLNLTSQSSGNNSGYYISIPLLVEMADSNYTGFLQAVFGGGSGWNGPYRDESRSTTSTAVFSGWVTSSCTVACKSWMVCGYIS